MNKDQKQSILLVGVDSADQATIKMALQGLDLKVVVAETAEDALGLVLRKAFFLIIFDVDSPISRPFEVAVALHGKEMNRLVPIIFQGRTEDSDGLVGQGYAVGGVDFLSKPVSSVVLLAKVKVFLELDARQRQLVQATLRIQEQNLELEERAIRDSLTSLYNHNYLLEQLAREVSLARRYKASLSVFLLDLDFFKDVNDSCGHPFGDFVLQEFAKRVKGNLRESDIFGRYGGEEFLIILPNTDRGQAEVVAEKIRENVAATVFSNRRYSRYVTVSIGVYSGFGQKIVPSKDIVDCVDNALYQAKAEGRNRVVHYQALIGKQQGSEDFFSEIVDSSRHSRLTATIEKARAMTLASFEAMVHAETRDYDILAERNPLFIKVLDRLAQKMNLSDRMIHSFRRAIKLHDLFRCYVQDSSMETEGALSREQRDLLLEHPVMLKELTAMFDFFAFERVMLQAHHEHFDGTGYPEGLKGDDIPMSARIFMLVDSFVAMLSPCFGRSAMSIKEAEEELRRNSGSQFDPFLVDMLLNDLGDDESWLQKKEGNIP
jgi:diguanylate cyclase (GGDEF)-like protein